MPAHEPERQRVSAEYHAAHRAQGFGVVLKYGGVMRRQRVQVADRLADDEIGQSPRLERILRRRQHQPSARGEGEVEASDEWTAAACEITTPFGPPVEPEVKMT